MEDINSKKINSAILDIAKYLRQRDQTAIKFLCDDIISDEKLIQCKNEVDLILLIKKRVYSQMTI